MATQNLGRVVGYSMLTGSGAPTSGVGGDGDSYLDTLNGDTYLKDSGAWSVNGNIKGKNGWNPITVADAETLTGKVLRKLIGYFGGEGDEPTENVGKWEKGDETYTSDPNEALDYLNEPSSAALALKADKSSISTPLTITAARALTGALTSPNIYITDNGQEGIFEYDPSDTTSLDNTGIILVTADGKRLKRVYAGSVNAKWFGAKGDGVADDTVALNIFATYVMSHKAGSAIMTGTFKISGKVSFIGATSPVESIYADCRIISNFTAEDEMVLFQNWGGNINGNLTVFGGGSETWSARTNGILIRVNNCSKIKFNKIYTQFAKYFGVVVDGTSYLFGCEYLLTRYCGSAVAGVAGKNVSATANVNSGSTNSTGQRSTLTLNELPIGVNTDTYVKVGSRVHQVYSIDNPNKKISVYPWIDNTLVLPQTIDLYMGGGIKFIGGDVSVCKIGQHDALACGIGLLNQALYPASAEVFVAQFCGIGHVLGINNSSASVGGAMLNSYYENNDFDFVVPTLYTNIGYNLVSTAALNLTKCLRLVPYLSDNTRSTQYSGFEGISIGISGKKLEKSNDYDSNFNYNNTRVTTAPPATYNTYKNTHIFDLTAQPNHNRLFGYQAFTIFGTGTGSNGQPTGTYTFTVESGYSINGGTVGASLIVSSMTGATFFYGRLNGTDWRIYWMDISNTKVSNIAIDLTSTAYTKSTINAAYASAKKDFTVIQDGAGKTYIKKDNSPTGDWSILSSNQLT